VIKLHKYLNNSRNFQNEISNTKSFIDLNNFLNKKIIETLFDYNMISNNIINEDKKNMHLNEEEDEIYDIINKIETLNINNNLNGVNQNQIQIDINNDFSINNNTKLSNSNTISNSTNNSNSDSQVSSINNSCRSSTHKKNISLFSEEDEKSLELLNKELNENRINIIHMNNISLYNFLNSFEDDYEKENMLKRRINREHIIRKFEKIVNDYDDEDEENEYNAFECGGRIKNNFLRKMACVKLYKAFKFLFKKYNIKKEYIRKFCKFIEDKARKEDYDMGLKYKEYIINVLKSISIH
jgi:hypothetical protein